MFYFTSFSQTYFVFALKTHFPFKCATFKYTLEELAAEETVDTFIPHKIPGTEKKWNRKNDHQTTKLFLQLFYFKVMPQVDIEYKRKEKMKTK